VTWRESKLTWAHRLDHYMKLGNNKIHYMQIFFSVSIVLCLSGFAYQTLERSLTEDFSALKRNVNRKRKERN